MTAIGKGNKSEEMGSDHLVGQTDGGKIKGARRERVNIRRLRRGW